MHKILLQFILSIVSCFSTVSFASETKSAAPLENGFSEVVITTGNPEKWIDFLTVTAGWEIEHRANLRPGEIKLWSLDTQARGETILLANKGSDKGFIRLVHLKDIPQDFIRADDRPWDTGGIFDLNMRVIGLYEMREKLLAEGWQGDSEPIQYVFGPFEVIEWIARGPDGVRVAFIERLKPALEGWPNVKITSRIFNSTTVVKDMKKSREFFEQILGMKPYLLSNKPSDKPGVNVLGLPHNMATKVSRDVAILHPKGSNDGSVELLQFVGATGSDFALRAKPHNLGVSALRFPVNNIDRSIAKLIAHGVAIKGGPLVTVLEPYGKVRIAGFDTPDGVRLEIFQIIKTKE